MTLKEFIKKNGLKINFLCQQIGVTRQTVLRIKNGDAVSPEVAKKISQFCGNDVEILINYSNKSYVRNRSKKAVLN